jgi:hypothetical protein
MRVVQTLVYMPMHHVFTFGRPESGTLESEFSGNLTEVCPTGVFTDKTHSDVITVSGTCSMRQAYAKAVLQAVTFLQVSVMVKSVV